MLQHQDRDALDRVYMALGDGSRRALVERLGRGPASVSALAAPLPMSLSAVVQHLKVLEGAGLVRSEKVGRVRTCRLVPDALHAAERWISERRTFWDRQYDALEDLLDEPRGDE